MLLNKKWRKKLPGNRLLVQNKVVRINPRPNWESKSILDGFKKGMELISQVDFLLTG